VQGEGAAAGKPTIFIRTGGCDFRCSWCDTMFAVDANLHHKEWRFMTEDEILAEVSAIDQGHKFSVTLSGGNPCMQPLGMLCEKLRAAGHEILIETQGTLAPDWLDKVDLITVSPKGPSSNMPFDEDE